MQPPAEDLGGTRRFSEEPQGAFGEDDRFANDIAAADVAEPPVLEKLNSGRVAAAEEAAIEELSATLKQAPNGANQANNGADVGEFFREIFSRERFRDSRSKAVCFGLDDAPPPASAATAAAGGSPSSPPRSMCG